MEKPSYLAAAFLGKHTPWRYISGCFLILTIWLVLGSLATVVLMVILGVLQGVNPTQLIDIAANPSSLGYAANFLVLNVSFLFLFGAIFLVVVAIHERPFRTVVTAMPAVNWKRIGFGGLIWLGLAAVSSLVEYLIWPGTFTFQPDWKILLPFAILVLLLTPIQAASEELLFRGYLVQGTSLISRNRVFLALLSGFLFMLPHLFNPEMAANFAVMALSYFLFGAFLAWISLVDGTIELAIGAHITNNLFATLLVTYPESAIPSPALFSTTHFDPVFSLIVQLIACAVFYAVVFIRAKNPKPLADF
jgi:CAAX protease family protein